MSFNFAFICVDIIFMYGGIQYIYTLPCTLVMLDFQRARAFSETIFTQPAICSDVVHAVWIWSTGLCKMYCTVPFPSCLKSWPLFKYRWISLSRQTVGSHHFQILPPKNSTSETMKNTIGISTSISPLQSETEMANRWQLLVKRFCEGRLSVALKDCEWVVLLETLL